MEQRRKPEITASFSYLPMEETLQITHKQENMFIGIPRENSFGEKRVALTPTAVCVLVNNGHKIWIEHNAGIQSSFSDNEYSEAGAKICYDKKEIFEAHIVIKTAPINTAEIELCKAKQIIISPIHVPALTVESINKLTEKKVIAIALGNIKDDAGFYPIVRSMSEIAGSLAILTAAKYLNINYQGPGILLGGISGVPSAKVIIIGAGVVAEKAARAAIGLGASVKIFDNSIYRLMRLQKNISHNCNTCVLDPNILEEELKNADVLIGALKPKDGIVPIVVTEEMVMKMKAGSVIVDVSIDWGGCIETSEITTHENPTFIKHNITHYCVPNMASSVPQTASKSISNVLMPLLLECGKLGGVESMLYNKLGLRNGIYIYNGLLTSKSLASKFNLKYTDVNLIISPNY